MKVSAFTFIKNGQILGYPFIQSIQSILPIVDEFIINVGNSEDDTLLLIKSIHYYMIKNYKSLSSQSRESNSRTTTGSYSQNLRNFSS